MNKTKCILLVVLLYLTMWSPASACMADTSDYTKSPKETVESAKNIYRVVLRSALRHDSIKMNVDEKNYSSIKALAADLNLNSQVQIHYSFDVLETIKGFPTPSFQLSLPFSPIIESEVLGSHLVDTKFWSDDTVGRAIITSDCLLTANFNFYDSYLLVLPEKPTRKSFERIEGTNDRWLEYVRETSSKLGSEK